MKFHANKLKVIGLLSLFFLSSSQLTGCQAEVQARNIDLASSAAEQAENIPVECTEFQKLIDQTYNVSPSKLTAVQQTAKSAEMDIVWKNVKGDQKRLVPCLIAALRTPNANRFFLFDGSNVLISLDKSEGSKKLLVESYAKADLAEIALQNWIEPILRFGVEGLDTSQAGDAWLKAKDPFYNLPETGTLKIGKQIGALSIYGSMDERFATPALRVIANQRDHPGREIAVDLLIKQVMPDAFDVLAKLDQSGLSPSSKSKLTQVLTNPTFMQPRVGKPLITREQYIKAFMELAQGRSDEFMDLTFKVDDGEKDAVVVLRPEDVPLVRAARRIFASTGAPYAPAWYQSFTDILMFLVRKPEIDKKRD